MGHEGICTLYEENYTRERRTFWTETQAYAYYMGEDEANTHTQKLLGTYNLEFHGARVLVVFSSEGVV